MNIAEIKAKSEWLVNVVDNPYCLGPVAVHDAIKLVVPALLDELGRMNAKLQEANEQIEFDNTLVKSLESQLAESQRRENAAVEDLKEGAKDSCSYCGHWGEDYPDNAPHCDKCMKPNYNGGAYCSRSEWEWRGPAGEERSGRA